MRGSQLARRVRSRVHSATSRTTMRFALLALVAAVVASIVVPAFASAESAADSSRPPHTGSSARSDAPDTNVDASTARIAAYAATVHAEEVRARVAAYVGAKEREKVVAYLAALARNAGPRHTRSQASGRTTGAVRVGNASSPGGFLACVRHHESGGNYAAVNGRSGTAGAYQFMPGTWNNTARAAGRPDLVGVNPAAASAADQDALAQHLYASQGASPWTGTGC